VQSNALSEHELTHEPLVAPQLLTQLVYCDAQLEPGARQFSSAATQGLSQVWYWASPLEDASQETPSLVSVKLPPALLQQLSEQLTYWGQQISYDAAMESPTITDSMTSATKILIQNTSKPAREQKPAKPGEKDYVRSGAAAAASTAAGLVAAGWRIAAWLAAPAAD